VGAEIVTDFTVFPAIDLRGGRCVRLVQGDFGRSKEYDADPVERAREWERRGARALHVVDLDGAVEGRPVQLELVGEIARSVGIPVQAGGGIRTLEDLDDVRDAGARRIVLGTTAVEYRDFRVRAIEELGADLVVAVDARDGVVATHGWRSSSGIGVLDLAEELASDGVATVLYTDVSRDGTSSGVALEETAAVASLVSAIASGGVRDKTDVVALSKIDGVVGVVVGRALYEGLVTLEELIEAAGGQ
jgi:phosphoribosylformimino-5-aminoimidazole carboxamide ribotide isomerase